MRRVDTSREFDAVGRELDKILVEVLPEAQPGESVGPDLSERVGPQNRAVTAEASYISGVGLHGSVVCIDD